MGLKKRMMKRLNNNDTDETELQYTCVWQMTVQMQYKRLYRTLILKQETRKSRRYGNGYNSVKISLLATVCLLYVHSLVL